MTFEEFVAVVEKDNKNYLYSTEKKDWRDSNTAVYSYSWKDKEYKKQSEITGNTYLVSESVDVGGISGGNCWGGKATFSRSGSSEVPKLRSVENILQELAPSITFLQFRKLEELFETEDWTEHEYYGNSTNYIRLRISLGKFYQYLTDAKFI